MYAYTQNWKKIKKNFWAPTPPTSSLSFSFLSAFSTSMVLLFIRIANVCVCVLTWRTRKRLAIWEGARGPLSKMVIRIWRAFRFAWVRIYLRLTGLYPAMAFHRDFYLFSRRIEKQNNSKEPKFSNHLIFFFFIHFINQFWKIKGKMEFHRESARWRNLFSVSCEWRIAPMRTA